MPEIVKYERIQTADTDLHAAQPDDDDITFATTGKCDNVEAQQQSDDRLMAGARFRFNVAQKTAATVALILFYFCLSIGLTFYQRWLLKVKYVHCAVIIHIRFFFSTRTLLAIYLSYIYKTRYTFIVLC